MPLPAAFLHQPASDIRARVAARDVSAREVTEAALARIHAANGTLNAIVALDPGAVEAAVAIDAALARGEAPGPLCGVPVGIKDVTDVAGVPTTYGSPIYAGHVPADDALVVARLRAAGAVIVGKTNTPEFAAGGNTFNDVFGPTRNPWDPSKTAGGSTGGGAAALASGMIALAEGTDLGGSLRIPAAFCGVAGLRPSVGLVPTAPTAWAFDTLQVTGPMARTVGDVALMLQAIAGPTAAAPLGQPVAGRDFAAAVASGLPRGTRVAYAADPAGIGVDAAIEARCRQAAMGLADAGATVEEVAPRLAFARPAFLTLRGLWFVNQMRGRLEHLERFGPNVTGNIRRGLATTTAQIADAEAARGRLWQTVQDLFTRADVIVTPCTAVPPFPVGQHHPDVVGGAAMESYIDWLAPTFVWSLTGLPVASVPCGLDPDGMPVGLQVIGPAHGEERVLAVAAAIERRHPIGRPPAA
ncbi:MAG: amidase [Vicinamibacterales bacterium]